MQNNGYNAGWGYPAPQPPKGKVVAEVKGLYKRYSQKSDWAVTNAK